MFYRPTGVLFQKSFARKVKCLICLQNTIGATYSLEEVTTSTMQSLPCHDFEVIDCQVHQIMFNWSGPAVLSNSTYNLNPG